MKILLVCESSGVGREAWRSAGFDAWSCDLLPADDGSEFHIVGDAIEIMQRERFDVYGMHPPCTFLAVSSIHWNNRGRGWENTEQALRFVASIVEIAGDAPWYLENPVSILSTHWRKPNQIIQPYDFGEDASKATCLWTNRLPLLKQTSRVTGRMVEWPVGSGVIRERWSNQTDSGQNRLPPSDDRWKSRSKSYSGIMKAMSDQWGGWLSSGMHMKNRQMSLFQRVSR